jgi:putative ribosome biogenesis GTPase RsgA
LSSNGKDLELVGYEDITELSRSCRYSNCAHIDEADCAVKKAIGDGILSEERFHSFYRDKKEAEYVSVQKNKTKAIDYVKQRKLFRKP